MNTARSPEIAPRGKVTPGLIERLSIWSEEVLAKGGASSPTGLRILVFDTLEALNRHCEEEQRTLGVVSGDSSEFLATHDAWHGYPRIVICEERIAPVPETVLQGVIHHEVAHALRHGEEEFYRFRFSSHLGRIAQRTGITPPMLQHLVYFISVALKDLDVVQWLDRIGLGNGQVALLGYGLSNTQEEQEAWVQTGGQPGLRKIVLAGMLKILLPLMELEKREVPGAVSLMDQWRSGYSFLPGHVRENLFQAASRLSGGPAGPFQDRLEEAALTFLNLSFPDRKLD